MKDIIVVDNFYKDPFSVRQMALEQKYIYYEPSWYSTSIRVRRGFLVDNPVVGFKYNDANVIGLIESAIEGKVNTQTWYTAGDGWNGAFHTKYNNSNHVDVIHHHFKSGDCEHGYSGVVYLNQYPIENSGTKIWKNKLTNSIHGDFGPYFVEPSDNWEIYHHIENKFNRLVLFKGDVFHSGDAGFGSTLDDCRLFQTFFFNVL